MKQAILGRLSGAAAILLTTSVLATSLGELIAQGTDPVDRNPKAFGAFMKTESAKWVGVIKQANIKAD